MVGGEGLRLAAGGVLIGLVCAFFATRMLRSLLYGVGSNDPLIVSVPMILLAVALLAAFREPRGEG
jgi:hypothetical protein